MALTLLLSPEYGGTTFGPFPAGTVVLGSDPGQCQITLPAAMGVAPVHVMLSQAGNGWMIQPATMGAVTVVTTKGRSQPLTTALPLLSGDSFCVGSNQGPRFTLNFGTIGVAPAGSGSGIRMGGRGVPTTDAMGNELKRQISTAVGTGPLQPLVHGMYRFKSGTFFQPRYVVTALLAVGMFLFTSCSGIVAVIWNHLS